MRKAMRSTQRTDETEAQDVNESAERTRAAEGKRAGARAPKTQVSSARTDLTA